MHGNTCCRYTISALALVSIGSLLVHLSKYIFPLTQNNHKSPPFTQWLLLKYTSIHKLTHPAQFDPEDGGSMSHIYTT
jgi:hypothetical protein